MLMPTLWLGLRCAPYTLVAGSQVCTLVAGSQVCTLVAGAQVCTLVVGSQVCTLHPGGWGSGVHPGGWVPQPVTWHIITCVTRHRQADRCDKYACDGWQREREREAPGQQATRQ